MPFHFVGHSREPDGAQAGLLSKAHTHNTKSMKMIKLIAQLEYKVPKHRKNTLHNDDTSRAPAAHKTDASQEGRRKSVM